MQKKRLIVTELVNTVNDFFLKKISAEELVIEGKNAIESPTSPQAIDLGPEFYLLGEYCDKNGCFKVPNVKLQ